jgi:hypothetical protein
MNSTNPDGLAVEAWIEALPDDSYGPCPCGCGKKFRFVMRDPAELEKHEAAFVANWKRNNS